MPDISEKEYLENLQIAAEYANREFNAMVRADPWLCHSSHYVAHVTGLPVIKALIQGYGLEPILWNPDDPDNKEFALGYIIGSFVNQGDPYVPTLIFLDGRTTFDYHVQDVIFEHVPRPDWNREGCFIVASWADVLEWLNAAWNDGDSWFHEVMATYEDDREEM